MPGKPEDSPPYVVFKLIRTENSQEAVTKSRKLEKLVLKINNCFLNLKFNH